MVILYGGSVCGSFVWVWGYFGSSILFLYGSGLVWDGFGVVSVLALYDYGTCLCGSGMVRSC